ncbi:MAG: hypothetical protein QGG40_09435, partial [Myxococcota bacterium]|nr:hypothetical protein [Myxococcota bacterium]
NVDLQATVATGDSECPATEIVSSELHPLLQAEALAAGLEGSSGSGSDRLLSHAIAVLGHDAGGDCMEGFLRDGARLDLLIIAGTAD